MNRNQRLSHYAVRAAIAALMCNGDASLEGTARQLGVSARSLQRYLGETGASYRELTAETRIKRACHLLAKSNERISDISARLGFANASSFSRAFMRFMKIQPRVYRRQQTTDTQCQSSSRKPARRGTAPLRPEKLA